MTTPTQTTPEDLYQRKPPISAPPARLIDHIPPDWRTMPVRILAAVCALLAACLIASIATRPSSPSTPAGGAGFTTVAKSCADRWAYGGAVSDGGKTLTFDMKGEDGTDGRGTINGLQCVLDAVAAPDYIQQQMMKTRALDGRQSASWSGITASWTYHPDHGLDVIFHQA